MKVRISFEDFPDFFHAEWDNGQLSLSLSLSRSLILLDRCIPYRPFGYGRYGTKDE